MENKSHDPNHQPKLLWCVFWSYPKNMVQSSWYFKSGAIPQFRNFPEVNFAFQNFQDRKSMKICGHVPFSLLFQTTIVNNFRHLQTSFEWVASISPGGKSLFNKHGELGNSPWNGHWNGQVSSLIPKGEIVVIGKKSRYHLVMFNIAMERSTMLLIGKPSISMGHLYHGYVSHNQRVSTENRLCLVSTSPKRAPMIRLHYI